MSDMFGMSMVDTNTILTVGYEFTKKQLKELEDLRLENFELKEKIIKQNFLLSRTLIFLEYIKTYGPLRTDIEELLENEEVNCGLL